MLLRVISIFWFNTVQTDREGRCLIAKIKIGDEELSVANIYAPNNYPDQSKFIRDLGVNLISKTDITKLVIAGDWNSTLFSKDKCGGLVWKEVHYRNSIIDLMEELDLVDIYRKLPNTKAFTYDSKSLKMKSRIDYFLVSNTIAVNVKRPEVRFFIAPDLQGEFKSGRDLGNLITSC